MSISDSIIDLTSITAEECVARNPIDLVESDDDNSLTTLRNQQKRRRLQSELHVDEEIIIISESIVINDDDEDQKVDSSQENKQRDLAIFRIFDIFPDIQFDHIHNLLEKNSFDVPKVVQKIAEDGSYPKAVAPKPMKVPRLIPHRHEKSCHNYFYDFMSELSFNPDKIYCQEATTLLKQEFRILSIKAIEVHFSLAKCHYAICHDRICQLLMLRDSSQTGNEEIDWECYSRLQRALYGDGRMSDEQLTKLVVPGKLAKENIKMKRQRKCPIVALSHSILQSEQQFVEAKQKEWKDWMSRFAKRRNARFLALETSSTIECDCCYGDVSVEELVQCRGGHLFCYSCLQKYSEVQIFANEDFGMNPNTKEPATDLLCMSGCGQGFDLEFLERTLRHKVLQKYHEMHFRAAVSKVMMEDLCVCPKCGYQAELPPSEMIFRCPIGDCCYESCRKCGGEPHIPLRCEEVEQKHQLEGRHHVEESISEAKIRRCPKPGCGKKFIKESGCNKIRCACGTIICYICRKQIESYHHFCQVHRCNHQSCKKCPLHSNDEDVDEVAMRAAGIRAAEDIRKKSASEGGTAFDGIVDIDVEDILRKPK